MTRKVNKSNGNSKAKKTSFFSPGQSSLSISQTKTIKTDQADTLVEYITRKAESGSLFDYCADFLPPLMEEFVASHKFAEMNAERRRKMFTYYADLVSFIGIIEGHANQIDKLQDQES